jgi:hypothetical protein
MIYSRAVITPVAVAAILILITLTTVSSTSQAFAYISYHKGHYHKGNLDYYTTYKHTRHVIVVTSNTEDNTANPPYENPPYENPPYENPP